VAPTRGTRVLREVARRPAGLFGLVAVGLLIVMAIAAPVFAPHDPASQDIVNRLEGPTATHLVGTDQLGRDIFSRLIYGTRIAFEIAIPTMAIAMGLGLILGVLAGYLGRGVDSVIIIVMDTLQAFPAIILALALIALLGPSMVNLIAVLAIAFLPGYARVARASVLTVKQNQFVEAERALGASKLRIASVHVVPNILAPLIIMLAMDIPAVIAAEAGLSFLGLGVQPPDPSWGVVLNDGFTWVRDSPWGVIGAGVALMITVVAFTLLGETLRDVVDPKVARIGNRRTARP
jgi:peptide/nickel transport system permease protein